MLGGKREGSGRKAPAGVRTARTIRFSDSEWQQIEQAAKAAGVTPSEYIRVKALQNKEE